MNKDKPQNKLKKRHCVIPTVHLFLIKKDKILLLRRYNTGFKDGDYSVPAGHIEKSETATLALIRESQEEIGVNISLDKISFSGMMYRKESEEERIDLFFTADEWQGEIKIMEPQRCDDLKWFTLNSLPTNLVPYIKAAIEALKSSTLYIEFGWKNS